ncbi:type III-A CRISPR-associated protein Csm2 [Planktothrix paucivesiculata]|uniref:CRISPR system Cms protein Csm2 n=1 Tax=Planktothrix paucivesiculata PCC 9631 TaxID=671071 RepID=A0A7Z9DZ28_9CYAN|nr:type III-A CRISPR-associated protein Csm2 [Planktothrix paucivesiculata]VXD14448.1 CRISPR-associated protein Csm2 family [Planktothrix paucivesiculata PCC 9631]
MPIDKDIENHIKSLKFLKDYSIRDLVKHAQEFGPYLKEQRLETNQVRKFLDAINRLKVKITQNADQSDQNSEENNKKVLSKEESNKKVFSKIEPEIVLLKPKLAYAAARQQAAKPLSSIMSIAIDKVHSLEDFERLVQFIESTIAYHKAEGGR